MVLHVYGFKMNLSTYILRWPNQQTKEGQRRSKFYLVGFEDSWTPLMSKVHVWPSDHREGDRSYAWPFYNFEQTIPEALYSHKAVGTIWRTLSKPQIQQGLHPRPLWLFFGIPKALRPVLAYRLCVAQHTLADVTLYFWFVLNEKCPYVTFYDLNPFVVGWSV